MQSVMGKLTAAACYIVTPLT